MFPDNISPNIDILVDINVWKNSFGFHSNRKTQGQKHRVNNLYFKYQVSQMKLRHLNTFLQFRLLFHEPHCMPEWVISVRPLNCDFCAQTFTIAVLAVLVVHVVKSLMLSLRLSWSLSFLFQLSFFHLCRHHCRCKCRYRCYPRFRHT